MDIKNLNADMLKKLLYFKCKIVYDNEGSEYVVFADSKIKNGFNNSFFSDKTAFEAYENHIHIAERLTANDINKFALVGDLVCCIFLRLLEQQFPKKSFTVYLIAKKNEDLVVRFHQNHQGETAYYNGNKFYDNPIIFFARSSSTDEQQISGRLV